MKMLSGVLKFVLTLILLYGIYFIFKNQEEIITLYYNTFKSEQSIDIKEANEYKRYYNFLKYSVEEDYVPTNKEDLKNILFNILNNGWDEFTFYCPLDYKNCIEDVKEISNDRTLLSSINNYVSPFNSFSDIYIKIRSDNSITISLVKNYSIDMINEVNNEIDVLMTSLNLDNYKTNSSKIKKIHNYIISFVDYDKNSNYQENGSTNAYGLFKNKKAVCSGYADVMALFLDRLGIPNFKVASQDHVWNLVYIDDKWLHLDVTWDDPINSVTNDNKYDYFLISTEELFKLDTTEHSFNELYYNELKEA